MLAGWLHWDGLAQDIGYADLGAFGHPTARTPHLDHFVSVEL